MTSPRIPAEAARAAIQATIALVLALSGAPALRSLNVAVHGALAGVWPFSLAPPIVTVEGLRPHDPNLRFDGRVRQRNPDDVKPTS